MRDYSRYTYTQIVHMRDVNVTCGQHLCPNVQYSDLLEGWDEVVQDVLALGDAGGEKEYKSRRNATQDNHYEVFVNAIF